MTWTDIIYVLVYAAAWFILAVAVEGMMEGGDNKWKKK